MAAKTASLALGCILGLPLVRAYRRTSLPALRALAVGIGLLTLGTYLGGVLHQVGGVGLDAGMRVQAVFTAAGFAILTYLLWADEPQRTAERGVQPDTHD